MTSSALHVRLYLPARLNGFAGNSFTFAVPEDLAPEVVDGFALPGNGASPPANGSPKFIGGNPGGGAPTPRISSGPEAIGGGGGVMFETGSPALASVERLEHAELEKGEQTTISRYH